MLAAAINSLMTVTFRTNSSETIISSLRFAMVAFLRKCLTAFAEMIAACAADCA